MKENKISSFILCCCNSSKWSAWSSLPYHCVAADHGDGRVPAVDSDGEVEGRDDANNTEGVPALQQSMAFKFLNLIHLLKLGINRGCRHSSWFHLHLPCYSHRFESQAHNLSFYQFVLLKL